MEERNFVELFCGYGVVTSSFKAAGFNVFSTDIRKRKGVCEPTLRKDIMQLTREDIPFEKVHILWASIPCNVWSYAAGGLHWNKDGSPKTQKCQDHIKILKKTLDLIDQIRPDIFFIENPRGKLRRYPLMLEFLEKHHAVTKELTLSSYGFPGTKPTNIFTNARDISFKELGKFGRGAKTGFKMDNISVLQKAKTPRALADDIVKYARGIIQ